MSKFIFLCLVFVLFLTIGTSFGQELPRSASFGASVTDLNDSTKAALKLSSLSGTLIQKIVPGSSAHKTELNVNDVLVSMDEVPIKNTSHFLELLKKHNGGDEIKISFFRNAKLITKSMILLPKQKESSTDYDIIYSSILSGSNHLRTIISKPKGGSKYPAVLIVGGVGCYSIDNPTITEILIIKMWVDSLTKNGFVTIRVEKTGMGDSKGLPCTECDFNTEKQAYLDGLKQLKSLPYVDKENIFITGLSIGGVIAPLIAQLEPVKGIIVYGTVGRNWLEYELDNSFRQLTLDNVPADSIDQFMRAEYIRLYCLFVEKKQPQQIINEHHETTSNFFNYPMKIEYFQQVADINIRGLWMNTKAKVLALHGSSDFVSSASEHNMIAEIVNLYNPGNAIYLEIPNADHWGLFAESEMVSYLHQQSELNPNSVITGLKWLKANL